MITQKRMMIPIFDYKLTVIIYDDWNEAKHLFDDGNESRGITEIYKGAAVVGINKKFKSTVVHEAEHIKNALWEHIGYTPQAGNDEVDAYLLTYIYEKIMAVFDKHDSKSN